jgi:hypothetical protein
MMIQWSAGLMKVPGAPCEQNEPNSMEASMRLLMFYSSVKQLIAKLEEELAIRILCLFIR